METAQEERIREKMIFRKSEKQDGEKAGSLLWVWTGAFLSLAAAAIFVGLYPVFRNRASAETSNPIEEKSNIGLLYGCNQILYRDLYNTLHKTSLDYMDLYYPVKEDCQTEIDSWEKWLLNAEKFDEAMESPEAPEAEEGSAEDSEKPEKQRIFSGLAEYEQYLDQKDNMEFYFNQVEAYFRGLSEMYDYEIRDLETGATLTNAVTEDLEEGFGYYFLLEFVYDEQGNMTIGNLVKGEDSGQIRRYAADLARIPLASDTGTIYNVTYGDGRFNLLFQCSEKRILTNCSIRYGMKENVWTQIKNGTADYPSDIRFYGDAWRNPFYLYYNSGVGEDYLLFLLVLFLLGLLLPFVDKGKPWQVFPVCRIPLEGILAGGVVFLGLENIIIRMVANANQSQALSIHGFWVRLYNLLFLALLFFAVWYLGIALRLVREVGVKEYVKQRSWIYRLFPFVKSKALGFYHSLENFDLTRDVRKRILKIVLVNAVILFIISSLWVGGFFITAIYSVLLYFLLVRYVSRLQKKYEILLRATNEIADGNLNVTIQENIGVFEPFKHQIYRIQHGFKRAVEEEVKSQRMKAELVTNVSHDLKTPLTAIITYIGLLQEEDITEEQRKEYLDTLERKSLRLKVLIEDLFEISKANSKAIHLNIVDVDILNLIRQVEFEMSDKLAAAGLEVRLNLPEERVLLPLDSQKTFRVYENLFGNIAKYALTGTRVYVSGRVTPQEVVVTLKNISREELNMDVSELTDRFVRGDASRNTEGSGLGLAIAKSFMELQGGQLELELEDDLFKVITRWKRPTVPEISESPR